MDHPTEIIGNEKRVLARLLGGSYSTEDEGEWIGPYRLLARLGEGGFGIVWRAEQTDPVQRQVALKVIKRGMDTQQVLSRFDQERQSLASMDHPSIAAMLDAGASVDGRPYFAMELVRGEAITQWCTARSSSLRERLSLFAQVCQAVSHAHQRGVIHRDLKPSNILVTTIDVEPVPKIIDFGIAKAMRASTLEEQSLLTLADQIVGTPLYMSPEQIEGAHAIDTRSDIYALGVLLYELLTGSAPFNPASTGRTSIDELKRSIREITPARPSRASSKISRDSHSDIPADLDIITLRALEKDPARRYQTALELADDVQRYLNDEPIHARAPSFTYVTGRWIKRHRVIASAACAVILAMIGGTAISLWQAQLARSAQHFAERQTELAHAAETRAAESAALAKDEAARAKQSATFLTELLDRVATEIDHGRNPEALKLALAGSEMRIEALGEDTALQLQLFNRVAAIYKRIGETKPLIPLLESAAATSAKLNGPTSEEAFKAELDHLKVVTDHGNRITAPALIEDLRKRVEDSGGRGSKLWFDVQRQLVRAYTKLKQPKEAMAEAEGCLAALKKRDKSAKLRCNYILSCVEAFEIGGDFQRARALLDQCVTLNQEAKNEDLADQIVNQQVHVCWSQRDFAGGAVLLREVVSRLKKRHGEQSPDVIGKLIELAEYEIDARELDQAITHATEALAAAQAALDDRESHCLALICLAKGEGHSGRHDDAIGHATEAEAMARELGNTKIVHRCVEMLAVLHDDAGHLEEAADYYLRFQSHIEAEHANYKELLEVMEEVCSIRARQGRGEEAMALAQELWRRLLAVPESKDEPGFTAEIANQCLVAYKVWLATNPGAPDPPHLAEWKAAADPSESIFSKLRKERKEAASKKP